MITAMIDPETFYSVDIRLGRIVEAEPFEEARTPAYKLRIDFGEAGEKRSSAQITDLYSPEQITGRKVLAVINLPPKRIAGFVSECLVLGVDSPAGGVALLSADEDSGGSIPLGTRVY